MPDGWYDALFPSLDAALAAIERFDSPGNYEIRNIYVLMAVLAARWLGFAAGFRHDPAEPEWPVAFIELPTGQVSWHLPQHPTPWDGHDPQEKYQRCRLYRERPQTDPLGILGGYLDFPQRRE